MNTPPTKPALTGETRGGPGGDRRKGFAILGLFFVYAVLQLIFRVATSDSAEMDEAEQLILGQSFQWGYGNQPPLYTWLQILLFAVCGTNVFALALLKSALIFGILAFTYLSVLEITADGMAALAAAASLFLLPHFAWEARRDLSHTVLAMAMVAAALYFCVRMLKSRRVWDYAGFGLSVGVGFLGKYNFPLFVVALVLGGLPSKHFRETLLNKKIWLSAAVFLGVTAIHLNWMLAHRPILAAGANKLRVSHASGFISACAGGLGSLVVEGLAALAILVLVHLAIFARAPLVATVTHSATELQKILKRTLIIGLVLCVAMVFCFQVRYKARWLLPLLMVAPVYLILLVRPGMDARRAARFLWVAGAAAVIALIALPIAAPVASLSGKFTRLNAPYAALASQLKTLGLAPGMIVAENRVIGGNLKLFFNSSTVVVPELIGPPPGRGAGLVVWDATRQPAMPPALAKFAGKLQATNVSEIQPHFVESRLKYSRKKFMKLGFVALPEAP